MEGKFVRSSWKSFPFLESPAVLDKKTSLGKSFIREYVDENHELSKQKSRDNIMYFLEHTPNGTAHIRPDMRKEHLHFFKKKRPTRIFRQDFEGFIHLNQQWYLNFQKYGEKSAVPLKLKKYPLFTVLQMPRAWNGIAAVGDRKKFHGAPFKTRYGSNKFVRFEQRAYLKSRKLASVDPLKFYLSLLIGQTSQHLDFHALQHRWKRLWPLNESKAYRGSWTFNYKQTKSIHTELSEEHGAWNRGK